MVDEDESRRASQDTAPIFFHAMDPTLAVFWPDLAVNHHEFVLNLIRTWVEITRIAARYAEEARVAVRNVRRHAMDELKRAEKDGGSSQDQVRDLSKQIQELTDQHIHVLDDLLAKKESEILQV